MSLNHFKVGSQVRVRRGEFLTVGVVDEILEAGPSVLVKFPGSERRIRYLAGEIVEVIPLPRGELEAKIEKLEQAVKALLSIVGQGMNRYEGKEWSRRNDAVNLAREALMTDDEREECDQRTIIVGGSPVGGRAIGVDTSWRKASITAIAKTLFRVHDFDSDRAVAIAYWFKKGKMITHGVGRYWSQWPSTLVCKDMTEEEALELLHGYNRFAKS